MGLALTALGGDLLPERTPRDAARLLAVRHAGIAAILAIAAPIAAHQLDVATQTAKERGVALVLDAPLPPQDKIKLAPGAARTASTPTSRAPGCRRAVAAERRRFTGARPRHLRRPRPAAPTTCSWPRSARRSARRSCSPGAAGLLAAALLAAGAQLAAMAVAGGADRSARRRPTPRCTARSRPTPPEIQDPCHRPPHARPRRAA